MSDQFLLYELPSDFYLKQDPIYCEVERLKIMIELLTNDSQMVAGKCLESYHIHNEDYNNLFTLFTSTSTTMLRKCEHIINCCEYKDLPLSKIKSVNDSFLSLNNAMDEFIRTGEFYNDPIVSELITIFTKMKENMKIFHIVLEFIEKLLAL